MLSQVLTPEKNLKSLKRIFDSFERNLQLKIIRKNPTDGIQIANSIKGLDRQHEVL